MDLPAQPIPLVPFISPAIFFFDIGEQIASIGFLRWGVSDNEMTFQAMSDMLVTSLSRRRIRKESELHGRGTCKNIDRSELAG
jgi:hypothetical protein